MKIKFVFIVLLLYSCTNNKFYGYVYDYDTEKPLKNVNVNVNGSIIKTDSTGYFVTQIKTNQDCEILLQKNEYAIKKVYRKRDSLGTFSNRNLKKHKIYMFKNDSDFHDKK